MHSVAILATILQLCVNYLALPRDDRRKNLTLKVLKNRNNRLPSPGFIL